MPLLADTATWLAVGFAVAAAAVALAASVILLTVVARRGRGAVDPQPRAAQTQQSTQAPALASAPDAPAGSRRLAEIAATIDLDAVLQRTLAAAASTDGIDAAMAVVRQTEELPVVATVGMSAEEAARQPVSSAPSGGATAVRISYRYDSAPPTPGGRLIRGGVAVPLSEEHVGTIGTLAVFWRGEDRVPGDAEIAALETLARTSTPAIRNAQEFWEARRLADVDPVTGAHNRRYFEETLERECARAHRYERGLTLVLLDIDDFTATNERLGRDAGDAVLAVVTERLRDAVRESDIACRVGGDELAVILPEAGARDAEQLYRRIQFAVGSGAAGPVERVRVSAGIAELRPEDDPVSLLERADAALARAKEGGRGRVERALGPGS